MALNIPKVVCIVFVEDEDLVRSAFGRSNWRSEGALSSGLTVGAGKRIAIKNMCEAALCLLFQLHVAPYNLILSHFIAPHRFSYRLK